MYLSDNSAAESTPHRVSRAWIVWHAMHPPLGNAASQAGFWWKRVEIIQGAACPELSAGRGRMRACPSLSRLDRKYSTGIESPVGLVSKATLYTPAQGPPAASKQAYQLAPGCYLSVHYIRTKRSSHWAYHRKPVYRTAYRFTTAISTYHSCALSNHENKPDCDHYITLVLVAS